MADLAAPQAAELAYEDGTPTPAGWRRKLIPYISKGLVATRIDVIFVSPTGDELRSKAQLQKYLKKHKESPSITEFIWSTDEGPRRSSRSTSNLVKLPSSTMSKSKSAAKAPLEESKASKRSHPEREDLIADLLNERNKRSKKKPNKVMDGEEVISSEVHVESSIEINNCLNNSTPKKEQKKRGKKGKDVKMKKNAKAAVKSSYRVHNTAEDIPTEQKDDEQFESGNQEKIKRSKKEDTLENGNDEATEQQALLMAKDEEIQETKDEMQEGIEVNDLKDDTENKKLDGTTASLLASDLSVEGMDVNCELVVDEKERHVHEENVNNAADQGEHANTIEGS